MKQRYIIIISKCNDSCRWYKDVFSSLDDAKQFITDKTFALLEYDGVSIFEVGKNLKIVAYFDVQNHKRLIPIDTREWFKNPLTDAFRWLGYEKQNPLE